MPLTKPTFGTVLVRRRANERPTDWELRLRPICQKVRVVEKLLGGAHLMLTGANGIAVRIYTADDASRLEAGGACDDDGEEGVDGLRAFRDSFEHLAVFFVLPSGQQQRDQLGRRESFVSAAQRSLLRWDDGEGGSNGGKKRIARTVVVSDVSQVIQSIDSFAQSLTSEKREKRRKYFAQVASKNFLPVDGTVQPTQEAIANHVTRTFNEWAERMEMPEGDSNVVLSMLGSLANVATATASTLDDVPITNASKDLVSCFFGAKGALDTPVEDKQSRDGSRDGNAFEFDDIDDSELMRVHDPSSSNRNEHLETQTPYPNIFETTAKKPVMQNNASYTGGNAYTPMVPTRLDRQPGYDETPSIFPASFSSARQNQFGQPPSTRGYQRMPNGYQTGHSQQMHGAGYSENGGFAGGQHYESYRNGNVHEYREPTYGNESWLPHQQFM
ncbi:hypothetical protein ACHAXT_006983 [Thalassiosira profunda]